MLPLLELLVSKVSERSKHYRLLLISFIVYQNISVNTVIEEIAYLSHRTMWKQIGIQLKLDPHWLGFIVLDDAIYATIEEKKPLVLWITELTGLPRQPTGTIMAQMS